MTTNIIAYEDNEPDKRLIRSDVLLFILVFFAACLLILGSRFLQTLLPISSAWFQLITFAVLLLLGWCIYRFRLITYRYSLSDRMFSVTRIVGKKSTPEISVHISSILSIRPYPDADHGMKASRFFHGKKEQATAICYREGAKEAMLYVRLSPSMTKQLTVQWKAVRK